jgi:hypothetical protein
MAALAEVWFGIGDPDDPDRGGARLEEPVRPSQHPRRHPNFFWVKVNSALRACLEKLNLLTNRAAMNRGGRGERLPSAREALWGTLHHDAGTVYM